MLVDYGDFVRFLQFQPKLMRWTPFRYDESPASRARKTINIK
jgi:hypothetical protein